MINEKCPCKRTSCERHGNCDACRKYHQASKRKRACERKEPPKKGSTKKQKTARFFLEAVLMMSVLQAVRELIEWLISQPLSQTSDVGKTVSLCTMLALVPLICVYAKLRGQSLSVFPNHFGKWYIIATCVATVLYITAPSNYTLGSAAIIALVCGSIVTPVFEELIFRGYLWGRAELVTEKASRLVFWNTLLFTVWHLGYLVPHLVSGNWQAVVWKLAAGVGYGILLSLLRVKTKNCYATILAHGLLNLFMV